jgi:hypothetical protein
MNQNLQSIFSSKYSQDSWRSLLSALFPARAFYLTPIERKDSSLAKHSSVESIKEIGDIILDDKSRILFYEIELTEGKTIARNRVELRNLIHTDVIPGDVDGIIATYFSPEARDWRLTFISKSLYWDEEMNEIKSETHPKRYTFVLGETESIKTAIKQFEWLLHQVKSREVIINDLIKTFSVEKISKEFFDGYRHQFQSFEAFIADNKDAFEYFKCHVSTTVSAADQQNEAERLIRNFVKKLLGRIVFLYFLQKKGWLGVPSDKPWSEGERDFIGKLFESFKDKINYYTACLVPLFFDTLNRKREDDVFSITNTKVPYLNGGLFDKDRIEPTDIKFNPVLFQELFNFFDQYNFTIDENSPDDLDIGIDPEMLGLLFENLLEDNRLKGTFYTPKEVVHFMCKESLSLHIREELRDKASPGELKEIDAYVKQSGRVSLEIIKKHAQNIDAVLTSVKICDPAIGSGAFPMGMVYEILRLKKELFGLLRKTTFNYRDEKLNIIRNSIYGVDLDKGAVDIARLRFWLSLIVDEEEPAPLPNLDYKIMQGDSLKESFGDIPLNHDTLEQKVTVYGSPQLTLMGDGFEKVQKEIEFSINEKEKLKECVNEYFKETNREKKDALHAQIDGKVLAYIARNVELKENQVIRLQNEIEQKYILAGANIADLKEAKGNNARPATKDGVKNKGKDYKKWESLGKELTDIARKKALFTELENSAERPYFLWNLYFADVLLEGKKGFDIVIGNPPYGVKVDDEIKDLYNLGSKDSYGVFIAMSLRKLLKTNGILSFIVSDTWLTIKTHYKLREQILNYQLKKIIRLHHDCFDATVNPCIFTLKKSPPFGGDLEGVIAADLTNISTRKEIPEFRDKLFHLESYTGDYTPKYAVYTYPQSLLSTNSNKPVIVGSPKLFQLMNDVSCTKEKRMLGEGENTIEVEIRNIVFNNQNIELVRFGDVAEVRQGLATGDNQYYLYQNPAARGNYKDINLYRQFLLTETDLEHIRSSDTIRLKVIEHGIHKTHDEPGFDTDRWFEGRYIAPYDKGGESDTDEGWLPNYYVPTSYFIDWSSEAVNRLKTLTTKERNLLNSVLGGDDRLCSRFQNKEYYFLKGIDYSPTGIYSPTFRKNSDSIFCHKSSSIFIASQIKLEPTISILNSKMFRYLMKCFQSHTIETPEGKVIEACLPYKNIGFIQIIESIKSKQSKNRFYNYLANEQKEIDRLVYELYGLNENDINEVETWFARRYPKLATYAYYKTPAEMKASATKEPLQAQVINLIKAGESRTVEFKSSLRYCLKQKSPQKYVEHSSFKNIAAFLNTEGGTLLIGVEDNGNITGLEDTDFNTFKGDNKKDVFMKHFDNLVEKYFGNGLAGMFDVSFATVQGKTISVVTVKERATEPVILKNPENNKEEFYIRRNASAKDLTMFEFFTYAREHWKG